MGAGAHVVVNADVRIMTPGGARAEALAWVDERLVAVGAREEVMRAAGPHAAVDDAAGATIVPGFIDAHHHACLDALYSGQLRLVPPRVTDIASLQAALRARAAADTAAAAAPSRPGDGWIVATSWDELRLAERRAPTRQELDDAVPDRPLMALHYSCHRAVANSRALELAGIGPSTPDPSGGVISRGHGNRPDGLLIERGMSRVEALARGSLAKVDAEGFFERLAAHHGELVRAGITRIVDAGVPVDLATLYAEADRRGLLVVPTVMMPISVQGFFEAPWDALEGPVTGERPAGSRMLEVGPLKLVFDGAPGCAMCLGWWQAASSSVGALVMALRDGSLDAVRNAMSLEPRLGRKIRTGIRIYARDEARDVVKAALDRGFAIGTHAIGNDAVDVALSAYEEAGARLDRQGRPRIEHATFLDASLVRRIAGVGAAVVTQPFFVTLPAFGSAPPIRGIANLPLRTLLDAGVTVAASSDFPVAGFDPLDGVRAAVTRLTSKGRVYGEEEKVSLDEALAMYTRTAAEVAGCAATCGTLEAGKRADFVVLDRRLDAASLGGARVRKTIVGGATVFEA